MKGIELAVVGTLVYFALISVIFRRAPARRRAGLMLRLFAVTLALYVVVYVVTPPILFRWLAAPSDVPLWLDLGAGLFAYAAAFFGGTLQLYNLAERGMSLRMLIDVYKQDSGSITFERIMGAYSAGRGMRWMYDKRLDGLFRQGLIESSDGFVRNTRKGSRTARTLGSVQSFMRITPPAIVPSEFKQC